MTPDFERLPEEELVIDPKTGAVRQAGTSESGAAVVAFKERCEASLYLFAKYVLKRKRLVYHLHGKLCESLQRIPPRRKLKLLPMGTFKTSVISQALPIHIHLQPEEKNRYWPGLDGSEMRVMLGCETEGIASSRLRWIISQWESNSLLRALWPHKIWENIRAQAKKWNEIEMVLPRKMAYPEPSIKAIGVGGAFIGHHYNVLIKDDIIGFEAMNSQATMETAWEWHKASRTRMSPDEHLGLEFILGTRWAPKDIYERMIYGHGGEGKDYTLDVECRALVENGVALFPEAFPLDRIDQLKKDDGVMFYLWRMNSAADPALTDFDIADLRYFTQHDHAFRFQEDERDTALAGQLSSTPEPQRGQRLTAQALSAILTPGSREEHLHFRNKAKVT